MQIRGRKLPGFHRGCFLLWVSHKNYAVKLDSENSAASETVFIKLFEMETHFLCMLFHTQAYQHRKWHLITSFYSHFDICTLYINIYSQYAVNTSKVKIFLYSTDYTNIPVDGKKSGSIIIVKPNITFSTLKRKCNIFIFGQK